MDDPTPAQEKPYPPPATAARPTGHDAGTGAASGRGKDLEPVDPGFDSTTFRRAAGQFATGVTVVTTLFRGRPKGLTVNSFSSVSLAPPLVLWNLGEGSDSHQAFMESDGFAVHILHAGQQELAMRFAKRGADKFSRTPWRSGGSGLPLLSDCLVALECSVEHRYPGGDHAIIVGRVDAIHHGEPAPPLIFHGGSFVAP